MATDEDDDGNPIYKWDAVDGGTTATVVVLLRGETAVIATVGDSAAVMLSRDAGGGRQSELMLAEHSPTNLGEYVRMRTVAPSKVKFVYDCPDFEEFAIFCEDAHGNAKLDLNSQAAARGGATEGGGGEERVLGPMSGERWGAACRAPACHACPPARLTWCGPWLR